MKLIHTVSAKTSGTRSGSWMLCVRLGHSGFLSLTRGTKRRGVCCRCHGSARISVRYRLVGETILVVVTQIGMECKVDLG